MIFTSSRHCETQATWENLFFTVPVIKLRMYGGRNSKIGASMEAETQVISNCTLFSDFLNFDKVWEFILISLQWGYTISSYPLSQLDRIWRLMGILAVHYNGVSKQHRRLNISELAWTILFSFQLWSLFKNLIWWEIR